MYNVAKIQHGPPLLVHLNRWLYVHVCVCVCVCVRAPTETDREIVR
jgi:hypothetical protein